MAAGSWDDLRRRLERLWRESEVAHRLITSAAATDGTRLMCFSSLATSAGQAADLARHLADQARDAAGEV